MAVRPELSSIASTLREIVHRVTSLAEESRDSGEAELASELFTVERSLHSALRRIERAAGSGATR